MNINSYLRYTRFVLLMVFLVILAGGVVRMTQSGMGCPDWPTCFGRWIPPTDKSQLPPDFEKYLKQQDIDHSFNAYHTWIEYINRLLGALLGIFIMIHCMWSFRKFYKTRRSIFWISLLMLVAVGFQGWLGKKVVDHNLAVVKITIHMLVALAIAALPVLIIHKLKGDKIKVPSFLRLFTVVTIGVVLIQIILGTEVREQIDDISKSLNYGSRDLWIARLDKYFLVHRSFSWLVALFCLLLAWRTSAFAGLRGHRILLILFVLGSFVAGLSLYFFAVPAIIQPLHLMMASMLVITLFSLRLKMTKG